MELSDAERRALDGIERDLRGRDRAFARRMDELSAVPDRRGPQRFACPVSRRELLCVLLAVVGLVMLQVVVILALGSS